MLTKMNFWILFCFEFLHFKIRKLGGITIKKLLIGYITKKNVDHNILSIFYVLMTKINLLSLPSHTRACRVIFFFLNHFLFLFFHLFLICFIFLKKYMISIHNNTRNVDFLCIYGVLNFWKRPTITQNEYITNHIRVYSIIYEVYSILFVFI